MKKASGYQAEDCNEESLRQSKNVKNASSVSKNTTEHKNAGGYHTTK